jgi:uncharacterized protein
VAKSQPPTDEGSQPEDVLRAFFVAMHRWERAVLRQNRQFEKAGCLHEFDQQDWLCKRLAIIADYCTAKRRVYTEGLSFGDPPKYHPRHEEITRAVYESAVRVVLFTQQHYGLEECRRYVLLKRGGRWLLDNVQSQDGRRWERGIL